MLGIGLRLTEASTLSRANWWLAARHRLDGVAPVAMLSPASGRSLLDGKPASDGALISRQGGVKYVIGKDGSLRQVAANALAYDHASGHARLKFEGQATNLCVHSSNIPENNCILRSNYGMDLGSPSPLFGEISYRLINSGNTSDSEGIFSNNTSVANGQYTGSAWLRSDTLVSARLVLKNASSDAIVASVLAAIGPDWNRVSITGTTAGAEAGYRLEITTNGVVGSLDMFGVQIEAGPAASSYIPTSGVAVTRPADVVPLWSGAGQATAWAWRGDVAVAMAFQTLLSGTGGDYLRTNTGNPSRISFDGGGSTMLTAVDTAPGNQGICFGWGPSGKRGLVPSDTAKETPSRVTYVRTTMAIGALFGLAAGQILDLDEIVAWKLPDRPSAAGCQSQARVWSA